MRVCVGSVPESSSRGEAEELGEESPTLVELQDGSSLMAEPFPRPSPAGQ